MDREATMNEGEQEEKKGSEYTCPMHPEVKADAPGKCPKCGMLLQPRR
ncbi:MAG TPA: heavy metal-binding domain-containing protein [bacterium]|nr:heavy metal-binding domain-containing protein [bacterium]